MITVPYSRIRYRIAASDPTEAQSPSGTGDTIKSLIDPGTDFASGGHSSWPGTPNLGSGAKWPASAVIEVTFDIPGGVADDPTAMCSVTFSASDTYTLGTQTWVMDSALQGRTYQEAFGSDVIAHVGSSPGGGSSLVAYLSKQQGAPGDSGGAGLWATSFNAPTLTIYLPEEGSTSGGSSTGGGAACKKIVWTDNLRGLQVLDAPESIQTPLMVSERHAWGAPTAAGANGETGDGAWYSFADTIVSGDSDARIRFSR